MAEEVKVVGGKSLEDQVLLVYSKETAGKVKNGLLPEVLKLAYANQPFELKPGEAYRISRKGAQAVKDESSKWDKESITQNVILEIRELTAQGAMEALDEAKPESVKAKAKSARG